MQIVLMPLSAKDSIMVSAVVARRAHNPEVVGSNPTPATKKLSRQDEFLGHAAFFIFAARLIYSTIKIFCVMLLSFILY